MIERNKNKPVKIAEKYSTFTFALFDPEKP